MGDFKKPDEEERGPDQGAAPGRDPNSATGIFGRETIAPRPAGEDDLLASLLRQSNAPQVDAPAPVSHDTADSRREEPLLRVNATPEGRVAPAQTPAASQAKAGGTPGPVSGPGEVTRILQRVKPQAAKQDLAGVFRQVPIEKPAPIEVRSTRPEPPDPIVPEASRPALGSFTRAFRELSAKSDASANSPAPLAPAPQPGGPGEFTKLFQSVQAPNQRGSSSIESSPAPFAPPSQPPATRPTSGNPDSLTQLFAKSDPAPEPGGSAWSPVSRIEPAFPAAPVRLEESLPAQGGFTQLFQALNQSPVTPKAADLPQTAPPQSSPGAAGGFTQLLESLSQKEPAAPNTPLPASSLPPASPLPPIQSGPPSSPGAAPVVPSAAGPGEYTRVISASALRESQARIAAAAGPTPNPAQPVARPPMPQMPGQPAMPQMGIGGAASPPQMPAPPAFAFPQMQAPPPPPAAAPAPQPGGLQKYLPLILLVNVFLMLAILLVLFFVLRHR